MNAPQLLTFVALLTALPISTRYQAALADPSPAASPSPATQPLHYRPLTWEERNELAAAGDRARRDPIVKDAATHVHDAAQALDEAMISKDQGVKTILDKLNDADAPGASPHCALTADEREELRIDRDAVQHSPEADRLASATSDYHRAQIQAMTTANPALASLVARLPSDGRGLGFRRLIAPGPSASGTGR
jgi:hypothetical protein